MAECDCGKPAKVIDTRRRNGYRQRRYLCGCGNKYNSIEIVTERPGKDIIKAIAQHDRLRLDQKLAIHNLIEAFK